MTPQQRQDSALTNASRRLAVFSNSFGVVENQSLRASEGPRTLYVTKRMLLIPTLVGSGCEHSTGRVKVMVRLKPQDNRSPTPDAQVS